jgi:NDP-sugar pyrophosphorylase family protein
MNASIHPTTKVVGFLEPRIVKVNQIRTPIISPAIIGDHSPILNTEVENSIIMEGAHIDCGRRITDSLIGRRVQILHDNSLPRSHRLILSDRSTITL